MQSAKQTNSKPPRKEKRSKIALFYGGEKYVKVGVFLAFDNQGHQHQISRFRRYKELHPLMVAVDSEELLLTVDNKPLKIILKGLYKLESGEILESYGSEAP
jgi:hypothetical protein